MGHLYGTSMPFIICVLSGANHAEAEIVVAVVRVVVVPVSNRTVVGVVVPTATTVNTVAVRRICRARKRLHF